MSNVRKFEKQDEYWLTVAKAEGLTLQELPGSQPWLISAQDGIPVALMSVMETKDAFEPHLQWFPWATPRNIYHGFLDALDYLTKIKNVIILTRKKDFFDGFSKRGVIRKVGFFSNMPAGDIHIYQGVKQ